MQGLRPFSGLRAAAGFSDQFVQIAVDGLALTGEAAFGTLPFCAVDFGGGIEPSHAGLCDPIFQRIVLHRLLGLAPLQGAVVCQVEDEVVRLLRRVPHVGECPEFSGGEPLVAVRVDLAERCIREKGVRLGAIAERLALQDALSSVRIAGCVLPLAWLAGCLVLADLGGFDHALSVQTPTPPRKRC